MAGCNNGLPCTMLVAWQLSSRKPIVLPIGRVHCVPVQSKLLATRLCSLLGKLTTRNYIAIMPIFNIEDTIPLNNNLYPDIIDLYKKIYLSIQL